MGLPKSAPRITVDQYLTIERGSPEKHEYLDGVMYAMAGESLPHGAITVNLVGLLYMQLRGKPCQAFTKDTKVRSGSPQMNQTRGLFSYPDIVVVCGEPLYYDDKQDVILNPKVIIEVLSPSTELFDRSAKFNRYYWWNSTFSDYVLVSQKAPFVEHFRRQGDDWTYHQFRGLDAVVPIASIGCTLPLVDVYDRVEFPEEPPEEQLS